ncbi:MAG: UDP-glucuronic acid dehydrogenase [Burkholderiales bacterium]|nr:UDP-glucuronic acid dehydrogenase [Burkholderiales bacterium]
MKRQISILCTDPQHPVNAWLERWVDQHRDGADTAIHRDYRQLTGGDFLFLVSCHQIIKKPVRDLFRRTLVLHASALPMGRGMSPHVWQILEGRRDITLTLLNAEDGLDSGDIWNQITFPVAPTALYDEIHTALFDAEVAMMSWAIENCDRVQPCKQSGPSSFYRKRTPDDSRIDPDKTITDQFDLLRVVDPARYPAYFELHGQKYIIQITKA